MFQPCSPLSFLLGLRPTTETQCQSMKTPVPLENSARCETERPDCGRGLIRAVVSGWSCVLGALCLVNRRSPEFEETVAWGARTHSFRIGGSRVHGSPALLPQVMTRLIGVRRNGLGRPWPGRTSGTSAPLLSAGRGACAYLALGTRYRMRCEPQ